jgi:hypothetical protein
VRAFMLEIWNAGLGWWVMAIFFASMLVLTLVGVGGCTTWQDQDTAEMRIGVKFVESGR